MKFKVVYNKYFPKPGWAIVLWPFVFFNKKKEDVSVRHFRHELQHCYDIKSMGVLKFYGTYLWYLIKGYTHRNHPLEERARQYQDLPLTAVEQKWFHEDKIRL